jgi:VanZ family protein
MTTRTRIAIKWILVIIWITLIFLFSNEVAKNSSARSAVIVNEIVNTLHVSLSESILTFLTRKAAHIFMYFVLGILIYNVIREYNLVVKRAILFSILFAMIYATTDEMHQLFISGRSGQVSDVMIDTIAASVGVGVYYLLCKISSSKKGRSDTLIVEKTI